MNISWLLEHVQGDKSVKFEIDREKDTCRTPRRNEDVGDALSALLKLSTWAAQVKHFFFNSLFQTAQLGLSSSEKRLDFAGISTLGVFVPVVPLFIEVEGGGQVTLEQSDVASFLSEQTRTLVEKVRLTLGRGRLTCGVVLACLEMVSKTCADCSVVQSLCGCCCGVRCCICSRGMCHVICNAARYGSCYGSCYGTCADHVPASAYTHARTALAHATVPAYCPNAMSQAISLSNRTPPPKKIHSFKSQTHSSSY